MVLLGLARTQGAGGPDASLLGPWLTAQTNLHSWSAEFVQTRTLKALTQPLVAQGRVWFAVPNRFRWELGRPAQTIAVREADEMVILYPRLKRAERYPLTDASPGPWRDALTLIEAGFPQSQAGLEAQFIILGIQDTNGIRRVRLEPRSAGARRLLPEIQVGFSPADGALRSTQLTFADGSTLHNRFTNAVLNPVLEPDLFRAVVPPEFKVVEPARRTSEGRPAARP